MKEMFEDLFVLEMTNNHLGKLDRGLQIIEQHSNIVRMNGVRAGIKFQFRELKTFIHKDFKGHTDIRYIKRITETALPKEGYALLVTAVRKSGCIPIATPFDEPSVDWCEEFEMPIIKVASIDSNAWTLLKRIAKANKPVIVSTGGLPLTDLDTLVAFFSDRKIPLAINHCISAYPTEDHQLELDQIDFLIKRYPGNVIGLSTHEYQDWTASLFIAYAKGARLFERHIDINTDGREISSYSSLPEQIDTWFKAYHKAREMCGSAKDHRRTMFSNEISYLNSYVRGAYARVNLAAGKRLREEDLYFAIPVQKGQLSSRELRFEQGEPRMLKNCGKDQPILVDMVSPYAENKVLCQETYNRGL